MAVWSMRLGLFAVLLLAGALLRPAGAVGGNSSVSMACDVVEDVEVVSCEPGVEDCCSESGLTGDTCAFYNEKYDLPGSLTWVLVVSAVVGLTMAFGIGANDSANSWGTSVGSGAISLFWACLLGGGMEWLGATLLGYGVSDTIRKGVAKLDDPECWACGFCDSRMTVYMLGMFASLLAAAVFLVLVTFTAMPVSTTHAIVGAVVGMTIVGAGGSCLNWSWDGGLSQVVASWVISPAFAGALGGTLYISLRSLVLKSRGPRRRALLMLPLLYFKSTFIMVFLILKKSHATKGMEEWLVLLCAVLIGGAVGAAVRLYTVPRLLAGFHSTALPTAGSVEDSAVLGGAARGKAQLEGGGGQAGQVEVQQLDLPEEPVLQELEMQDWMPGGRGGIFCADKEDAHLTSGPSSSAPVSGLEAVKRQGAGDDGAPAPGSEEADAISCFRHLLVYTAALEAFGHGANDTANATGAFTAVYVLWRDGLDACGKESTPWWVMAAAGFFVALGVFCFAGRVIETIGRGLAKVDFLRGFCIELASTLTVVLATVVQVPVSTTHCQVGAVVVVGYITSRKVQWPLLSKVMLTWVLTLPFAGALSAATLALLRPMVRN